jgi:hypothetical protein
MNSDKTKWVLVNNDAQTTYTLGNENWPSLNGKSPEEIASEDLLEKLMDDVFQWTEDYMHHEELVILSLIWEKLKSLVTENPVLILSESEVEEHCKGYTSIGELTLDSLWYGE